MAISGNGQELEALEQQWLSGQPMKAPPPPVQAEAATETYDAMMRGRDTVQMLRDMARYNTDVANAIERTMAAWHGHTRRLMGELGK
ncbi:MAG TPA: hypothetical protein VFR19_25360 [Hyphomicrobiaceae bacterium]|jgi:hypothetical protein|nr:hypothetical protein [Hyphomicrobiaceae bacterium]